MIQKIELVEFASEMNRTAHYLLGRVSFEERSMTIPLCVKGMKWKSPTVFSSVRRAEKADRNVVKLRDHFRMKLQQPELDVDEPLRVAETLRKNVEEFAEIAGQRKAIVDITSFRREELLMLFAILGRLQPTVIRDWKLAYTSAFNMGE